MTLDDYLTEEPQQEEFECPECGSEVDEEYKCCSQNCFDASLI